jgi:hypothetical protein
MEKFQRCEGVVLRVEQVRKLRGTSWHPVLHRAGSGLGPIAVPLIFWVLKSSHFSLSLTFLQWKMGRKNILDNLNMMPEA